MSWSIRGREADNKAAATSGRDGAFDVYRATHGCCNGTTNRQAETCTGGPAVTTSNPIEFLEHLLHILLRNSGAVIQDRYHRAVKPAFDRYGHGRCLVRILVGILEQIENQLIDQRWITQ